MSRSIYNGEERCRHCGEKVRRSYADYTHGWTHEGSDSVWCRTTMASVRPSAALREGAVLFDDSVEDALEGKD